MLHSKSSPDALSYEPLGLQRLDISPVPSPPFDILLPCGLASLALVPSEFDTATDVFRDTSIPAGFLYSTIYSFDPVPSLRRHDVGQVCSR